MCFVVLIVFCGSVDFLVLLLKYKKSMFVQSFAVFGGFVLSFIFIGFGGSSG